MINIEQKNVIEFEFDCIQDIFRELPENCGDLLTLRIARLGIVINFLSFGIGYSEEEDKWLESIRTRYDNCVAQAEELLD